MKNLVVSQRYTNGQTDKQTDILVTIVCMAAPLPRQSKNLTCCYQFLTLTEEYAPPTFSSTDLKTDELLQQHT